MTEHIAKVEILEGFCPMCGVPLEYGNSDVQDGLKWYDVSCANCRWEGRQWDKVTFTGYTVTDEETGETLNVESSDAELGVPASEHDPQRCGCKYLGNDIWSCGHIDNEAIEQMDAAVLDKLTAEQVIEKLVAALDDMTDRVEQEHVLDHEDGYVEGEPGDDCLTCCDIKKATQLANHARTYTPRKIRVEVKGGVAYCDDPRVEVIDHDNH